MTAELASKVQSVARTYRRKGYRVHRPRDATDVPEFLSGFAPDLIAESEGDRVVIEVKHVDQVRGSNMLVQLAGRVSRNPGWRLELVAIPTSEGWQPVSAEALERLLGSVRALVSRGEDAAAFALALEMAEALLHMLARHHGIRGRSLSAGDMTRRLEFMGFIPAHIFDVLRTARKGMTQMLTQGHPSTSKEVEALLSVIRHLAADLAAPTEQ